LQVSIDWRERAATAMLDLAFTGVIMLNGDLNVVWASPFTERLLGPIDQFVGLPGVSLLHPDEWSFAASLLSFHAQAGDHYAAERPHRALSEPFGAGMLALDASGGWTRRLVGIDNRLGDPNIEAIVVTIRPLNDSTSLYDALDLLASGAPAPDVISRVLEHGKTEYRRGIAAVVLNDISREVVYSSRTGCEHAELFGPVLDRLGWDPANANDSNTTGSIATGPGSTSTLPSVSTWSIDDIERSSGEDGQRLAELARGSGFRALWRIALDFPDGRRSRNVLAIWSTDDHEFTLRPSMNMAVTTKVIGLAIADAERRAELVHRSKVDPLTGLFNRRALDDAPALWEQRPDRVVTVLSIDLNRFKPINDSYGHIVGDKVLQAVASRLGTVTRASDVVIRLGGDEFVVLCPDLGSAAQVEEFAERVQREIERPINIDGLSLSISGAIGRAAGVATDGIDVLLARSDDDLLANKRSLHANGLPTR
jgi:diguanylate cyclase (GGDEF)-like protein